MKSNILSWLFILSLTAALPGLAQAEDVEVELTAEGEAFVGGCVSGGYSEAACVCLVSYLIEDGVTTADLESLDPADYAADLQSCADANQASDQPVDGVEQVEMELTEAGQAFVAGCVSGGYSEGACVCLVSVLVEDGVTADDLATMDIGSYARELNNCQSVN